jgi:hypothetical protein
MNRRAIAYLTLRDFHHGALASSLTLLFLSSPLSILYSLAQRPSPEARKASLPTLPKGG